MADQWPVVALTEKADNRVVTTELDVGGMEGNEAEMGLAERGVLQLISEITSPSPFPAGTTPITLVTAPPPPPPPTPTQPAAAKTSSFITSFQTISSPTPLPSDHVNHSAAGSSTTMTMMMATAAATTTTTSGIEGSGGGSANDNDGSSGGSSAPDSGLSTAAAAGIGVGSTVGGVLLLILVGWFVQRRKRLAPTASRAYDRPLKDPAEAAETGGAGGIEMSSGSYHRGRDGGGGRGGAVVTAEDRV